jgi:hypothetical protein
MRRNLLGNRRDWIMRSGDYCSAWHIRLIDWVGFIALDLA